MISISAAINVIIFVLIGGVIFGLLLWLVDYLERKVPFFSPYAWVARVVLVVVAVLVLIGILLSLATGTPVFRP